MLSTCTDRHQVHGNFKPTQIMKQKFDIGLVKWTLSLGITEIVEKLTMTVKIATMWRYKPSPTRKFLWTTIQITTQKPNVCFHPITLINWKYFVSKDQSPPYRSYLKHFIRNSLESKQLFPCPQFLSRFYLVSFKRTTPIQTNTFSCLTAIAHLIISMHFLSFYTTKHGNQW